MTTLQQLIAEHRFVRVTAADFNGKDWDGAPLEPLNGKGTAEDLSWAMSSKIMAQARGGTDYAWFCVKDENASMNEHWAGPGDYLFHTNDKYNPVVVVPKELMDMLLASDGTVTMEGVAAGDVLGKDGSWFHYAGRTYTEGAIAVLKHLMIHGGASSLADIATGMGVDVRAVDLYTKELHRADMIQDLQDFKVTPKAVMLLASKPELLPGKPEVKAEPKLERSRRDHHYLYDGKTFTEGAIRTLMALAKGQGTPNQIAERTGLTPTTVVDGMTQLKNSRLIADGQTPFERRITVQGHELLRSNPSILPE